VKTSSCVTFRSNSCLHCLQSAGQIVGVQATLQLCNVGHSDRHRYSKHYIDIIQSVPKMYTHFIHPFLKK
jgi:hypothetical protein